MKKFLLICSSLAMATGYAQLVFDYLKAADSYFAKGDYYSAAVYYENYLGVGNKTNRKAPSYAPYTVQVKPQKGGSKSASANTGKAMAMYRLAECYRLLHYPSQAATYYRELANGNDKTNLPLLNYQYGTVLRSLGQYEEAGVAFDEFLGSYSTEDDYKESAKREVKNLVFIQSQLGRKDMELFTVNKLPDFVNAGGANYAPVRLDGNSFLFTSTRNDTTAPSKNKNDNRLYQAVMDGSVQKASLTQVKDMQQGVAAISADGNTLYLTRWSSNNSVKESHIYHSKKENGSWSAPVKVEGLNQDGYSTQQPFLTSDSKILFASNRPGGQGGFDLYEATLNEKGEAVLVNNLGLQINTKYDEQAPYFHGSSSTLVFSSNGRTGMGGFDFYHSKWNNGNYAEPVNFGHPVNSIRDDMYFTSRGGARNILEDVMFSSDRAADCCLELFTLNKQKPLNQIMGKVVNCETNAPIANATVKIMDTINNQLVKTITTGEDGSYSLSLEEYQPLKATASQDGYTTHSIYFNAPVHPESIKLNNEDLKLCTVFPPPVGVVEELENIYFDYDKYTLLEASFPTLDKLAQNLINHPNVKIELGGHTDGNGEDDYNQVLSQRRAESCVNYLISKGVSPEQLVPKGYGESVPVAPNANEDGSDNPEGRAKNRRTEFKVILK